MAKLWESAESGKARGAAGTGPGLDPDLEKFLSSLAVDSRLLYDDMTGSMAHARMLGATGIIPSGDAGKLVSELDSMLAELRSGKLVVDPQSEDVHSFIEAELTARLGDVGRAVHAGRSRNDQVATALRLYLRRSFRDIRARLLKAMESVLDLASEHRGSLMPGYTHLQRAQGVTLAHHLLAWCAGFERDCGRLRDAEARANECPLGSGALAGSGLRVDREFTAAALGFARPTRNTMDSVADRDACVELASAASMLMTRLSRACEEIILWASTEYRFVSISEAASTGSSIMPQKRNPDPAELIRGKTGRVYGSLMNLLVMQKGLAYAYDRDLQEDKAALFDLCDTTASCLSAFATLVKALRVDAQRMRSSAGDGFLEATDLAEYMVLKGIPFRTAYAAAKSVVMLCLERGLRPADLSTESIRGAHPALEKEKITHEELVSYLDLEACVARRDQTGGPAAPRTTEEIARLRAFVASERAGLAAGAGI